MEADIDALNALNKFIQEDEDIIDDPSKSREEKENARKSMEEKKNSSVQLLKVRLGIMLKRNCH